MLLICKKNTLRFGRELPLYINLVRDPTKTFVSRYYFDRFQSGHRHLFKSTQNMVSLQESSLLGQVAMPFLCLIEHLTNSTTLPWVNNVCYTVKG